jgi:hypothetical protein
MKINDDWRTNETLHISEIWTIGKQQMEQRKTSYHVAKMADLSKNQLNDVAKTAKTLATSSEAAPQKPGPDSYGWLGFLLFAIVFVFMMIPKSFWGSVLEYLKQERTEIEPISDQSITEAAESPKPTNSPTDETE